MLHMASQKASAGHQKKKKQEKKKKKQSRTVLYTLHTMLASPNISLCRDMFHVQYFGLQSFTKFTNAVQCSISDRLT